MNADKRVQWIAVALLECERKMRRIESYRKLALLQSAFQLEMKPKQRKAT